MISRAGEQRGAAAAVALARVSASRPYSALLLWCALLIFFGFGVAQLEVDTTTDSFLDRDSRSWKYYEWSQKHFGGDEIIVVALPAREPYSQSLLTQIVELTRELQRLPGVRRVDSLSSVPLIHATARGTVRLDPALSDGAGTAVSSWAGVEAIRADRIAYGNLISRDGRVGAINVWLKRGYNGYEELVAAVDEAVADQRAWVSGVPVFRAAASKRTREEILQFVPLTILAMAMLLGLGYRSLRGVVVPLAVGGCGAVVIAGMMGFSGVPLSLITMTLPSVLIAIGCAYAMHMVSASRGTRSEEELGEAIGRVARPVFLSAVTTAVGFAAVGTVEIEEVRRVGGFGAVGALVLGLATLTLAPALLAVLKDATTDSAAMRWGEISIRAILVKLAFRHRCRVLGGCCIAVSVLGAGVGYVEVETDATKWFPPGNSVRDAYDRITEALSGISPVNVVVQSTAGGSVTNPDALRAIDGLTSHLESLDQVGRALSIRDPLRQIHGGFTDEASQPLPVARGLAEQYLLLLESVEEIGDLVTGSRDAANIPLRVDDNGSKALLSVEREAEQWWTRYGVEGFETHTTGIMYEFARAEDVIAIGQIKGLALAFVAISLVLLLFLRDLRLSVVALLPNVVPIIIIVGVMGWLGVALDAGTVIVASLALGIAVDDTIHLVDGFGRRAGAGQWVKAALEGALSEVLHPIVMTTAAIAIGFGLLGLSEFALTRNLGLMVGSVAILCLVADLFVLPALLVSGTWLPAKGQP